MYHSLTQYRNWLLFVSSIFLVILNLSSIIFAIPVYQKDIFDLAKNKIGIMEIDTYNSYKAVWLGGVEIQGQFEKISENDYEYPLHYIQSINTYDDPTPKKYIDGSTLPVPLIDTPPGGYDDDPFDYMIYYDEYEFPLFYDVPSTYMLDAITESDNKLQMSFETWLVCVCEQSSQGLYNDTAWDDAYYVAPLQGWIWGYSIEYFNNNDGLVDPDDFTVSAEPFEWLNASSDDWLLALNQKYGNTFITKDWFNVKIYSDVACDCNACPEPTTAILLAFGTLGLLNNPRNKQRRKFTRFTEALMSIR